MQQQSLLLVEDDPVFSEVLGRTLSQRGFILDYAQNSLIEPLRDNNNEIKILILTGYASIATAVEAIKLGADNYLAKPADTDEIINALFASANKQARSSISTTPMSVKRLEWEHIQKILVENQGNISRTARELKMHRRTLQRKLPNRPIIK